MFPDLFQRPAWAFENRHSEMELQAPPLLPAALPPVFRDSPAVRSLVVKQAWLVIFRRPAFHPRFRQVHEYRDPAFRNTTGPVNPTRQVLPQPPTCKSALK
jgi:hypothetical protein